MLLYIVIVIVDTHNLMLTTRCMSLYYIILPYPISYLPYSPYYCTPTGVLIQKIAEDDAILMVDIVPPSAATVVYPYDHGQGDDVSPDTSDVDGADTGGDDVTTASSTTDSDSSSDSSSSGKSKSKSVPKAAAALKLTKTVKPKTTKAHTDTAVKPPIIATLV